MTIKKKRLLDYLFLQKIYTFHCYLQYIKEQMRRLDWHVTEDRFVSDTPLGATEFVNVIATQNPRATRRIVLACHFDSKYMPRYARQSYSYMYP